MYDPTIPDEIQKAIAAMRKMVREEMLANMEGRTIYPDDDDDAYEPLPEHARKVLDAAQKRITELLEEITRLERRFLEETKAHDRTRHILECRERELERVRSNFYKNRVEETMSDADKGE
jgi:hypothetical protein